MAVLFLFLIFVMINTVINAQSEKRIYIGDTASNWSPTDNFWESTSGDCPNVGSNTCYRLNDDPAGYAEQSFPLNTGLGYHTIRVMVDIKARIDTNCRLSYTTDPISGWNIAISVSNDQTKLDNSFSLPDTSTINNQASFAIRIENNNGASSCFFDQIEVWGVPYTSPPTKQPTISPTSATSASPTLIPTTSTPTQTNIQYTTTNNLTRSRDICSDESNTIINTTYKISLTTQSTCIESILKFVFNLIEIIDIIYYDKYNIFVESNITQSKREQLSFIDNEPICDNITIHIYTCFDKAISEKTLVNITKSIEFEEDINHKIGNNNTIIYITNVTIIDHFYPTSSNDTMIIWILTGASILIFLILIVIFIIVYKKRKYKVIAIERIKKTINDKQCNGYFTCNWTI
eukprot:411620_1